MEVKFLKRNIFQRFCGISATPKFNNPDCWSFSNGKLTIDLKKIPELGTPGGAIRLEGGDLPVRILVVSGEDKQFHVFHPGKRKPFFELFVNSKQNIGSV